MRSSWEKGEIRICADEMSKTQVGSHALARCLVHQLNDILPLHNSSGLSRDPVPVTDLAGKVGALRASGVGHRNQRRQKTAQRLGIRRLLCELSAPVETHRAWPTLRSRSTLPDEKSRMNFKSAELLHLSPSYSTCGVTIFEDNLPSNKIPVVFFCRPAMNQRHWPGGGVGGAWGEI